MSNREQREYTPYVHVLMALARPSHGQKSACIRTVDKGRGDELEMLESKLKVMGGYWRIHKTVNARCVEKARKWLICKLISHPEKGSYVDSEWKTALLQPECIYGDKKFMLDVDTTDKDKVNNVANMASGHGIVIHKSPNGYHFITKPFDTREVCKLDYVTLIRDGYYFIKEVKEQS